MTDTKDAGNHLNYSGATKLINSYAPHLIKLFSLEPSELSTEEKGIWDYDCNHFYNDIAV